LLESSWVSGDQDEQIKIVARQGDGNRLIPTVPVHRQDRVLQLDYCILAAIKTLAAIEILWAE